MITLDEIMEIALRNDFSLGQVGYMIYKENSESFKGRIRKEELQDLTNRGVLDKSLKINRKEWEKFKGAVVLKTIKYKLSNEMKYLVEVFKHSLRKHEIENTSQKKIDSYFNNNEELGDIFYTWICMWPTDSSDKNTGWEIVFQIRHSQFKLRRILEKYAKFFQRTARKPNIDIGVFMYATFLFIKSHIRDGKAFIPKIQTFIDDWEEWYERSHYFCQNKTATQIIEASYSSVPSGTSEASSVTHAGVIMD